MSRIHEHLRAAGHQAARPCLGGGLELAELRRDRPHSRVPRPWHELQAPVLMMLSHSPWLLIFSIRNSLFAGH
jgi:hypothetical protein